MIITHFQKVAVVVICLIACSCDQISNIYPDGDSKILVLSDIHITNSESKDKRLTTLIDEINKEKYPDVEMVITCGDNVSSVYDRYTPDSSYSGYNRLQRFMDLITQLKKPYLLTMGNHEFKIEKARDSDAPYEKSELLEMEGIWQTTTGFKPYYSKSFNKWKFIVLNSMDLRHLNRRFGKDQLEWLENELKDNQPTLIFFHHPIRTDNFRIWDHPAEISDKDEEPGFYSIMESNKQIIKGIFVGHGHSWVQDVLFDEIKVFETASFGDDEESPFLIIGLNHKKKKISVGRSPFKLN